MCSVYHLLNISDKSLCKVVYQIQIQFGFQILQDFKENVPTLCKEWTGAVFSPYITAQEVTVIQ